MIRPIRYLVAAALLSASTLLSVTPALAAGPGFDCAKATRQIEKAICAWDTVGSLDGRMTAAFKATLAAQKGDVAIASVRAGQKAWLAERDRRCGLGNVTPKAGSEEGLNPRQFGQLLCLQAIYPPRIAQLMDIAAPPLVPLDIKTVPVEPLRAAYPENWRQAGYQAQFSPDKTLMALGIEDGAGYVMQVWLYEPASGQLVIASPPTHRGKTEKPEDIAALDPWIWGRDGRFYVRANRLLGTSSVFGADIAGYAELRELPPDVAEQFAAFDAARKAAPASSDAIGEKPLPGFNDDSHDEQEGGAFTAWAQNKGHGSFDLLVARRGDTQPRLIASGGSELENFQFSPTGTRLFYNGEDGLLVTDPDSRTTRRLKGTHGTPSETRPINMSADGEILVYSAGNSCTRDAAEEADPNAHDDNKRVCLAYLAPVDSPRVRASKLSPTDTASANSSSDPWVGQWNGGSALSATIRRGAAKPDYLVIDLHTGSEGCSGAVTLYGKPKGATVLGESYDSKDPSAPVCRVDLSLDSEGALKAEVAGPCTTYHGASCGFDGIMTRGK